MEYTRHSAIVTPSGQPGAMYGLVPYQGMPDYVPFRRWSRSTLGPPPLVKMDQVTAAWTCRSEYETVEGDYWYGGFVEMPFGHFVTETITRVWWYLQNYPNDYTAVFVPNPASPELTSWQQQVFEYFKINRVLLVETPTQFQNLVIPQQGALLFSDAHDNDYQDTLYNWNLRVQGERETGGKVFLTRPAASSANVIGEERLAQCFADAGYRIYAPEEHSIADQLSVLRGATHVVGVQGSAFHAFNLLGHSPADILLFQRLGENTGTKMIETLSPYVSSVSVVPAAVRFSGRSGSNHDATLLDGAELESQTRSFDPAVDLSPYLADPTLRQLSRDLASTDGTERSYLSPELAGAPSLGKASRLVQRAEQTAWRVLAKARQRMSRLRAYRNPQ